MSLVIRQSYSQADLTALGFPTTFTNIGVEDTTGPEVVGLTIDTPIVDTTNGPATVELTVTVTDDLSGV